MLPKFQTMETMAYLSPKYSLFCNLKGSSLSILSFPFTPPRTTFSCSTGQSFGWDMLVDFFRITLDNVPNTVQNFFYKLFHQGFPNGLSYISSFDVTFSNDIFKDLLQ